MSVGNTGQNWSSTAYGTLGMYLNFGSQYLGTSYGDARGAGFQLRCLSE